MRKSITVVLFLIAPLVLLGVTSVSQAQLIPPPAWYLYDDFRFPPIDPALWSGSEGSAGLSAPNTESARKLEGKQLYIGLTTWGKTTSNSGNAGNQSNRLAITNPGPVAGFQADVTVKKATVVGCAANATSSRARAQINGGFFNDGSSSGPGDRTGDILAGMQSHRDSLLGDQIAAFISRCSNAGCTATTNPAAYTFTTIWARNAPNTMKVQWDQTNHQFIYTLNPGAGQEQVVLNYGLLSITDTAPPVVNFKQLAANNSAASCLDPAPRGSALMWALFDNVWLYR